MDNLFGHIDGELISEALAAFKERQDRVDTSIELVKGERDDAFKLYLEKDEELKRLTKKSLDLQKLVDLALGKDVFNSIEAGEPVNGTEIEKEPDTAKISVSSASTERKRIYFPIPLSDIIVDLLSDKGYILSYRELKRLLKKFYETKYQGSFEINTKTLSNAIWRANEQTKKIEKIQFPGNEETYVGLVSWFDEYGNLKAENKPYEEYEETDNNEPF